jgi:hypothetical protein
MKRGIRKGCPSFKQCLGVFLNRMCLRELHLRCTSTWEWKGKEYI